jgi:hypothetical protein
MTAALRTTDSYGHADIARRWLRTWSRQGAAVDLEPVQLAPAEYELDRPQEIAGEISGS